ncbi:conserved membrane protein of unknown function [Methylocella tundrae]|uniref:ATP synthase subunit I n=2 Tax=Methylocella tundrae TaxID=227605 RepID=A0A4U8Z3R4_METTU|nr:conserved membrane protein of unknown function [Methylocella tundrae]
MLVRVEMDQGRMNFWPFDTLPAAGTVISLVAYFAGGVALGLAYFAALWQSARLFASGGHTAVAVALTIGRFILLGGALALASLHGAPPLLAMALGVLIGRALVMRRLKEAAA